MSLFQLYAVAVIGVMTPVVHALFTRALCLAGSNQKICLMSCLTMPVLTGVFFWFTEAEFSGVALGGFATLLVTHVYFHFFNMSESARRVQIIVNLFLKIPGVSKSNESLARRLKRLDQLGSIIVKDEKWYANSKFSELVACSIKGIEHMLYPARRTNAKPNLS